MICDRCGGTGELAVKADIPTKAPKGHEIIRDPLPMVDVCRRCGGSGEVTEGML